MIKWLLAIALIITAPALLADSITLEWDPSPSPSVAGYNLYYGTSPGAYSKVMTAGNATNITINVSPISLYYFAVTAYDSFGVESDYSNELVWSKAVWIFPANSNLYTFQIQRSLDLKTWLTLTGEVSLTTNKIQFYRLKGTAL